MKRPSAIIRTSKVTMLPMKICNNCGESTVVYTVIQNAPICENCCPKEIQSIKTKKVPSESSMVQSILDNAGSKKILSSNQQ